MIRWGQVRSSATHEVGDGDGVAAAEVEAAAGPLAVVAPLLADEAFAAVVALVDGAVASARSGGQHRRERRRCAAAASVGCLPAGGAAEPLVGPAG